MPAMNPATKIVTIGEAHIPAIGCGTWQLRGETCARVVAEALRIGYRHIDTAQGYGNEGEVGEGIRASGVPRHEIFITTKVRPQLVSDGPLQQSAEESLERLGVDHVDLLLIHWPNPAVAIHETMRALSDAKRRGFAHNIGVSNFTASRLREAIESSPQPIVTDQIEYHPYLDQTKMIAAIRASGLALTAYCPIALGRVVNDPVLSAIGEAHSKSAAQVTLRWLVQQQNVIAIPKASGIERLRENLDVFDFELTNAEMDRIGGLKRPGSRLINEPDWVAQWD